MRHAVYTRNLGRSRSWRKATVRSLAQALLREERIQTTRAKAKEAQRLVERLVTLGKKGTLAARRRAISALDDTGLVHRLFSELAPRFQSRSGGYTRILRNGFRAGDNASMAILELVELSPERRPQQPKEKAKGKEKPKPRSEKPKAAAPEVPMKPGPDRKAPEPEAKKPQAPAGPKEKPKPHGFLDGLRKFFKGREKR